MVDTKAGGAVVAEIVAHTRTEAVTAPTPAAARPRAAVRRVAARRRTTGSAGARLTGFGAVVLAIVIVGLRSPPNAADRQILVLVWSALATMFLVGVLWPLVAVRRITVSAESPRDATVGERVPVAVRLGGRLSSCEVRVLDPTSPWHRVGGPGGGTIAHLADRRGIYLLLRVEVRVTAPLGILAAHRVHHVTLPARWRWRPGRWRSTGCPPPPRSKGGSTRSPSRRSAATWSEACAPTPPETRRTWCTGRPPPAPAPWWCASWSRRRPWARRSWWTCGTWAPRRERKAASCTLGAALAVLAAGGELVLCTAEPGGPVTGRVRAPVDAGRRLARAVEGQPGVPPGGWPVVEIGA